MKTKIIIAVLFLFTIVSLNSQTNDTYGNPIYEFSLGDQHYVNSTANVLSQPGLTGSVVGVIELNSELEIIERTDYSETIEGTTHYWYKIKFRKWTREGWSSNYQDITGYIWGGYIALETGTFVLDNNIEVYCYYRVSIVSRRSSGKFSYHYYHLVSPSDIFIYINRRRISNASIQVDDFFQQYWRYCYFYEENGNILLQISDRATYIGEYLIDRYGNRQ